MGSDSSIAPTPDLPSLSAELVNTAPLHGKPKFAFGFVTHVSIEERRKAQGK